jgi:hypothetical protein
MPPTPERWGWRGKEIMTSQGCDTAWEAQGRRIGWTDGENVYLDPESSYAEAQRLGDEQGERLAVGRVQLNKRLDEQGLLASKAKGKLTNRRTILGVWRTVLHIRLAPPTPEKAGEAGEAGEDPAFQGENHPVSSPAFPPSPENRAAESGDFRAENQGPHPVHPVHPVSPGRGSPGGGADCLEDDRDRPYDPSFYE